MPLEMLTLAQRWISEVSVLAERKGIHLSVDIDPKLPTIIYGDEDAMSKIALNLLSNAIKFTHEGSVTLKLFSEGEQLCVAVHDTSIGIPSHGQHYIFDEFRQVDGSSKRKYGGTGLGLAIVNKLAFLMNGQVNLVSEIGKGSTFTLRLPLKTSA
jgi:signal transduction histidine kinase